MKDRCDGCEYYKREPSEKYGKCYRFPPCIPTGGSPNAAFPEVRPGDWCGEWTKIK